MQKPLSPLNEQMLKDFNRIGKTIRYVSEHYMPIKKHIEYSEGVLNRIMPTINTISGYMNNVHYISNYLNNIKVTDINELHFSMYKSEFAKREKLMQTCIELTIFPPVKYLIDNNIYDIEAQDLEKLIFSEEIKNHCMELIKDWKNIFGDKDIVNRYIDEIQSNFFLNNNASVNLLIYALLEWLFEKEIENLQPYKRYNKIKDNLKLLFEELNLLNIYNHFIENNLYADTNKEGICFSRHSVHGRIDLLLSYLTNINLIFIYDFIQDWFIFDKIKGFA